MYVCVVCTCFERKFDAAIPRYLCTYTYIVRMLEDDDTLVYRHVKVPKKVITRNLENHRITEPRVLFLSCISFFFMHHNIH